MPIVCAYGRPMPPLTLNSDHATLLRDDLRTVLAMRCRDTAELLTGHAAGDVDEQLDKLTGTLTASREIGLHHDTAPLSLEPSCALRDHCATAEAEALYALSTGPDDRAPDGEWLDLLAVARSVLAHDQRTAS